MYLEVGDLTDRLNTDQSSALTTPRCRHVQLVCVHTLTVP